jgi:glycogen operon protein
MNGHGLRTVDEKGQKITDDSFYIIFNAYEGDLDYKLPSDKYGDEWIRILDTHENYISEDGERYGADEIVKVHGRSVVLLKQP